jgi:arsenate reductase
MNILFICTHNRCRSILSEAITNHLSQGRINASSAGSEPAGQVHPLTLHYLQQRGIATDGLRSQSWDEFESSSLDVVITVCDNAASEACPVWFGNSIKVHWGLADPTGPGLAEAEREAAFDAVMSTIEMRIRALLALDFESLSPAELQQTLMQLATLTSSRE